MSYLVATDGSTESDKAIRYAARQAVAFYETLVIAHVLTPDSELIDGTLILPGEEAAVEAGEDILSNARRLADEAVGATSRSTSRRSCSPDGQPMQSPGTPVNSRSTPSTSATAG